MNERQRSTRRLTVAAVLMAMNIIMSTSALSIRKTAYRSSEKPQHRIMYHMSLR